MKTPYYTKKVQTLPIYSHEYAQIWVATFPEACVIATRVDNGGSVLRKDPDDPNAIQAYTYTLSDENTTNQPTVTAYYSSYPDPNPPPSTVFNKQQITVEITSRCEIEWFKKDQAIP